MNHERVIGPTPPRRVWNDPAGVWPYETIASREPLVNSHGGLEQCAPQRPQLRTVMVPLDGTPLGEHAIPHAIGLSSSGRRRGSTDSRLLCPPNGSRAGTTRLARRAIPR